MTIRVKCDECGKLYPLVIEHEVLTTGEEKHTLACPYCEMTHIITVSVKGLEIREKIQAVNRKAREARKTKGRIPNYLSNQLRVLKTQMEKEVVREAIHAESAVAQRAQGQT